MLKVTILITGALLVFNLARGAERIAIQVEKTAAGAPITLGVPFAQGALSSPDRVRLLDNNGNEIPCQVTEVSSWEPLDFSVKWIWVFFFASNERDYILEYGEDVERAQVGEQFLGALPAIRFAYATHSASMSSRSTMKLINPIA